MDDKQLLHVANELDLLQNVVIFSINICFFYKRYLFGLEKNENRKKSPSDRWIQSLII